MCEALQGDTEVIRLELDGGKADRQAERGNCLQIITFFSVINGRGGSASEARIDKWLIYRVYLSRPLYLMRNRRK